MLSSGTGGALAPDTLKRSFAQQDEVGRFGVYEVTGPFRCYSDPETPLPQAKMQQLASAAFMQTAHNLILVGGTGTGKSNFATALGVAAVHQGKRVRFYNAVDLVDQLETLL